MVLHRAFMRRCLSTSMNNSVLLLGRGPREDTRRLDGVETRPEQKDSEEEGDYTSEHEAQLYRTGQVLPSAFCSPTAGTIVAAYRRGDLFHSFQLHPFNITMKGHVGGIARDLPTPAR